MQNSEIKSKVKRVRSGMFMSSSLAAEFVFYLLYESRLTVSAECTWLLDVISSCISISGCSISSCCSITRCQARGSKAWGVTDWLMNSRCESCGSYSWTYISLSIVLTTGTTARTSTTSSSGSSEASGGWDDSGALINKERYLWPICLFL